MTRRHDGPRVTVVGGGLAGCEAAYQLAQRGVKVRLLEMRPVRRTEAHATDRLGELVCSNSLRDDSLLTAVGVLKEELRRLDSIVMRIADATRVPAGSALAVDRELFAQRLTREIESLPGIDVERAEATSIPEDDVTIVATGPLTSPALSDAIAARIGAKHLYFYDAISPIVTAESIDDSICYRAARYGKGGDDYTNCPMDREQYERFVDEVLAAQKVPLKSFERCTYFAGCMPIEEIARRGRDTLRFGPMKPVGLADPRTGRNHYAVVQLRQDDTAARMFSMVGFQTKMTYPEQRRVFRMIPGLENAEFVRLGSLHRNTYVDSPRALAPALSLRADPRVMLAGQLVGVEGYVESTATGLLCGINAARRIVGLEPVIPPTATALGSLLAYVTDPARRDFQPMNANFGLFPPPPMRVRGREKKRVLAEHALAQFDDWIPQAGLAISAGLRRTSSL
jgi:methylenetetrahydrofolate--tRNA-(uracil-5-)-methyltransferase